MGSSSGKGDEGGGDTNGGTNGGAEQPGAHPPPAAAAVAADSAAPAQQEEEEDNNMGDSNDEAGQEEDESYSNNDEDEEDVDDSEISAIRGGTGRGGEGVAAGRRNAATAVETPQQESASTSPPRSTGRQRRAPDRFVEELIRQQQREEIERGGIGNGGKRKPRGGGSSAAAAAAAAAGRGRGTRSLPKMVRSPSMSIEDEVHRRMLEESSDDDDDDDDDNNSTGWKLPKRATWPTASPTPLGDKYISIVDEGIRWSWTFYDGAVHGFHPRILWYTSGKLMQGVTERLQAARRTGAPINSMPILYPMLPDMVLEYFFSEENDADNDTGMPSSPRLPLSVITMPRAFRIAAARAVPVVNAYVFMDNDDARTAAFLLSQLPVRLYRLHVSDFIRDLTVVNGPGPAAANVDRDHDDPYDRMVAVAGGLAVSQHRLPALIIHASPGAISATAVSTGRVVAGLGLTGGIADKLKLVTAPVDDNNSAGCGEPTREENHENMHSVIRKVRAAKTPLQVFGGTLIDQRIGAALYEAGAYLSATVDAWKAEAVKDLQAARNDPAFTANRGGNGDDDENGNGYERRVYALNTDLTVVATGVDSEIVQELLSANHGNLVHPVVRGHPPNGHKSFKCTNAVSKGVQELLRLKHASLAKMCDECDVERARWAAVGCRVAKRFHKKLYRGTVVSVTSTEEGDLSDDLFKVLFDDGDIEDYEPFELLDHLQLYGEKGEEWTENDPVKLEMLEIKNTKSLEAADLISRFVQKRPAALKEEDVSVNGGALPNGNLPEAELVEEAESDPAYGAAPSAASSIASGSAASGKKRKEPPKRGRGRPRKVPQTPTTVPNLDDLYRNPDVVVGRRVARFFDDPDNPGTMELFCGRISGARIASTEDEGNEDGLVLWDISYDDGDEESLEAGHLLAALKLYEEKMLVGS